MCCGGHVSQSGGFGGIALMKAESEVRASGITCSTGNDLVLVLKWFLRNQIVQDNCANSSKFKLSLLSY